MQTTTWCTVGVFSSDHHVLALRALEAELGDGGGAVVEQPRLVLRVGPRLGDDLGAVHRADGGLVGADERLDRLRVDQPALDEQRLQRLGAQRPGRCRARRRSSTSVIGPSPGSSRRGRWSAMNGSASGPHSSRESNAHRVDVLRVLAVEVGGGVGQHLRRPQRRDGARSCPGRSPAAGCAPRARASRGPHPVARPRTPAAASTVRRLPAAGRWPSSGLCGSGSGGSSTSSPRSRARPRLDRSRARGCRCPAAGSRRWPASARSSRHRYSCSGTRSIACRNACRFDAATTRLASRVKREGLALPRLARRAVPSGSIGCSGPKSRSARPCRARRPRLSVTARVPSSPGASRRISDGPGLHDSAPSRHAVSAESSTSSGLIGLDALDQVVLADAVQRAHRRSGRRRPCAPSLMSVLSCLLTARLPGKASSPTVG